MKLVQAATLPYSQGYWDNYYDRPYEESYLWGFRLKEVLDLAPLAANPPQSFLDVGCGPGHVLKEMIALLPENAYVYGIECQDIPRERQVADVNIIRGDFVALYKELPPVDLVYANCSMYVPWEEQADYLKGCAHVAKKWLVFGNVYLSDRRAIPEDRLRRIIYKDRESFSKLVEQLGFKPLEYDGAEVFVRV